MTATDVSTPAAKTPLVATVALDGLGEDLRGRVRRAATEAVALEECAAGAPVSQIKMWRAARRLLHWLRRLPLACAAMLRAPACWPEHSVRVPPECVRQLCGGVDGERLPPDRPRLVDLPRVEDEAVAIGAVGRVEPIMRQAGRPRAFRAILAPHPGWPKWLCLIVAGEGLLIAGLAALPGNLGIQGPTWLPRARGEVAWLMRAMNLFVPPPIKQGTSGLNCQAISRRHSALLDAPLCRPVAD